ncbi:MAG: DMT family transporter [Planctomycetota bacterium]|nr:MAG: DMT family transporter [Planctomycetota bacterium]
MLWLIVSIITSVSFSIGLKISEAGGRDRVANVFIQYVAGTLAAGIYFLAFTNRQISPATIYVGIFAGFTWAAAVTSLMVSINEVGLAISGAITRLSVILPVVSFVIFWQEKLSLVHWAGVALVCIAIIALSRRATERKGKITAWGVLLMALLFTSQGLAQVVMKMFDSRSPDPKAEFMAFMMILFAAASVFTGIWFLASKRKIKKVSDIGIASLLGVINLSTGVFWLFALEKLPGAIVFAVWNAAGVLILAVVGVAVWREKLGKLGIIGIALTIIALVLLRL